MQLMPWKTEASCIISAAMSNIDTEEKPPPHLRIAKLGRRATGLVGGGLLLELIPILSEPLKRLLGNPVSSLDGGSAWVSWLGGRCD
jgi:hypothetical protein